MSEKARELEALLRAGSPLPADWPQLLHDEYARLEAVLAQHGAAQNRQTA